MRLWKILAALGLLVTAAEAQAAAPKSLYNRLGGYSAIRAVVNVFVAEVAADRQVNRYFARANGPSLKYQLAQQLCQLTGGPCTHTGKTNAYAGITPRAFYALVTDLNKSLVKLNVKQHERAELVALVARMQRFVVKKKV